ncbi:MAG: AbrB/MazE/SpoVT family DNA-binding domain-containing protein [Acidimicrobiia bacterium]|nr:AbrB/MazE/SpoVT family DNA-binding domain-containing protein [Acidimicrobiia bacterium]
MSSVKVSPKFQVVIPKEVRDTLHIKPGQRLQILSDEGSIRLVPVPSVEQLRGLAKGGPALERDSDRDL